MKIPSLLLPAVVALAPLSAVAAQPLVKFDGGIGAIGASAAIAADGTGPNAATVTRNIVRGVQPPAQLWTIADLTAEVDIDGHIKVDGRGPRVRRRRHHRDCGRDDQLRWKPRHQCYRHTHL
jgi:hypothetical protein